MMETITLSTTDNQNNQTLHVAAGVLDNQPHHHHHHHSPVDEEQMMNLSDMTDLSQDIQEDIVAIPKEVILISLVSQEQALYNPKHENYRNTQRKDIKWMEISENVGWTEMQCKAKWKAMRDQYCRELKRSKFNVKANVKWKYFKELDFLRPYALARNYRPRNPTPQTSNNPNAFNCSPGSTSNGISAVVQDNSTPKFTSIKIESTPTQNFTTCEFSSAKSDTSNNNLTEEQLTTVLQQQSDDNNWTYITGSNNSSTNTTRLDNHSLSDTQHLLSTTHHHSQQQTDEAFYNALVDCVGQIQQQQQQLCQQQSTCQQQQQQHTTPNIDEEDDDPIHTFLNIESYFEKELIALIQSEDVLYNSFNPNYRNVKLKLEVWDEIARKLKKTVKQCRLKWKALRDQFIREHKRLKNRENIESLPRWKHYDALSFLQKFIKHKASDYDATKTILQIPKTEIDADMDDDDEHINIGSSSPLRSPLDDIKCELSQPQLQLQHLTGVTDNQELQQQNNHQDNLCVSAGSVGGYDDMDIDNYIIGDSGSVVDEQHNDPDENEQETADDHKPQQEFSVVYSNHNTNISNDMGTTGLEPTNQSFEEQQDHQTQQQQQHINMPSLDLNDTSTALINADNLTATTSYQQNPLNNGPNITLAAAVTALDACTATPSHLTTGTTTTLEASTNTDPLQVNTNSLNSVNQEDDEVGAFFKAVAMKIRNAKLSPVAFTDLQIDILRVINGSLRNH